MRIVDLLSIDSILLHGEPKSKEEALSRMVELMERGGRLSDVESYRKKVFEREKEGTTGIGDGIAIPHGKSSGVKRAGLAAMVVPGGVEFDALDGQKVTLLFLIAAPDTQDNVHLDVLSKLSVLLMDETFTEKLRQAKSPEDFLRVIDTADAESLSIDKRLEKQEAAPGGVKLLAVTSCPTGIAHTYMAAEGLQKAASAKGYALKIETRGSGGAKNVLTSQEIAQADCIIVAADAQVPMERFDGKRVIVCPVADGIHKADALITQAVSGTVERYHAKAGGAESYQADAGGAGHKVYTWLMNGVSHMLAFVVGGGILIALAFLIDGFCVDVNSLTEEMRSSFGSITPIAALLKEIGGIAFSFMLPVLAGFIAMSIADRPALAPGFVGGMIASGANSGFLGALTAGFLAGFLMLGLKRLCAKLPEMLEKIAPVLLYPLFGILLTGILMLTVVEPVMGAVNQALNHALMGMSGYSTLILGLVLGGMMAIDMGGPFNKAAYVFGVASIAAGKYDIMAAVMVGGMVPPCAIALSTLLFYKKYTKEEREAGPANFIMGLAFITEGAIPYAAADPLRVLPPCIVGAGIAGALSMTFGCTLMAPHGGIFVLPVVGNALWYAVALVIGTVSAALLLGMLKKSGTA